MKKEKGDNTMTIRYHFCGEVLTGKVLKVDDSGSCRMVKVTDNASGAILWIPVDWVLSE